MKVTQMPPVHAANLVANSGNTAYGVDVITSDCSLGGLFTHLFVLWSFTYKPHEFRVLFTSLWKRHQPLPRIRVGVFLGYFSKVVATFDHVGGAVGP